MELSQTGLDLIKRFEGLRLKAYPDGFGHLTIGYGHTGPDVRAGSLITAENAEMLLRADVRGAEAAVARLVKVPLTQGQFDALVDFTFNEGEGNLATSTLLRLLNQGDYAGATEQFACWNKVTKHGVKVVSEWQTQRRAAEASLFEG